MDTTTIIATLLKWALGLVGAAIVAIVSSHWSLSHKLAVLTQRILDHIENCELLHKTHAHEIERVQDAINDLRKSQE